MKAFDEIGVYQKNNNIVSADDIEIRLDTDGTLLLEGGKTPISFIRLVMKRGFPDGTLILGDAWERGYAEFEWAPVDGGRVMPWYFAAKKDDSIYCFGVKTQPNAFCSWQCDEDRIVLTVDVRNGSEDIVLNGRILETCTILYSEYKGNAMTALQEFCSLMCGCPRLPTSPVYGGNDWYCNYGDNSFEKIIKHTKRIVECSPRENKPYMVIDDGWELCRHDNGDDIYFNGGPWKYCNENFGDMKKLAEEIVNIGAVPGIWFRPLWTVETVPEKAVRIHEGITNKLDPSADAAINKIKEDVRTIKSWGYKLIKHDFSTYDIFGKWGFEDDMMSAKVHFSDRSRTTAEIIKDMYMAIREAAGDDVLIMGCNTISHLSAGIFEIQRTGDDTSGKEWERTKKYGINTLAFRMPQHNRFYCADADCVGITNDIPWDKNRQWLDVLSKSGTPLFVSIAEDAYSDKVKKDIKAAFERAAVNTAPSEAVNWIENKFPDRWRSVFGEDKYIW